MTDSPAGTPRYFTRPMTGDDIPQVLTIDHEAFAAQWPPLTYSSLKQELRNRLARYIVLASHERRPARDAATLSTGAAPGHNGSLWSHIKSFFQSDRTAARSPSAVPTMLDHVVGYAGLWKMVDEVHIISIAVRHDCRGCGLGETLLIAVIELALQLGARVVTLEVRVSNRRAQGLYVKYGFRSAGVRHNYYADNNEDALIMTTETITGESFQNQYQQLKKAHGERGQGLRAGVS